MAQNYKNLPYQVNHGETLAQKIARLDALRQSRPSLSARQVTCDKCGDKGIVEVLTIGDEVRVLDWRKNGNTYLWDNPKAILTVAVCDCQQQKLIQKRINSILSGDAEVPEEFRGYTFESWDALPAHLTRGKDTARQVCEYFAHNTLYNPDTNEEKYGLVLSGHVGTGKSGLASATLMERARRGHSVLWIDFRAFLRKVRATYERDHETSYDEIISMATTIGCLLFDDLGDIDRSAPVTDNVREICYDVIGERYNQRRATIITTNLGKGDLVDQFGDRLASRIQRLCYWQELGTVNIRNQHDPLRRRS